MKTYKKKIISIIMISAVLASLVALPCLAVTNVSTYIPSDTDGTFTSTQYESYFNGQIYCYPTTQYYDDIILGESSISATNYTMIPYPRYIYATEITEDEDKTLDNSYRATIYYDYGDTTTYAGSLQVENEATLVNDSRYNFEFKVMPSTVGSGTVNGLRYIMTGDFLSYDNGGIYPMTITTSGTTIYTVRCFGTWDFIINNGDSYLSRTVSDWYYSTTLAPGDTWEFHSYATEDDIGNGYTVYTSCFHGVIYIEASEQVTYDFPVFGITYDELNTMNFDGSVLNEYTYSQGDFALFTEQFGMLMGLEQGGGVIVPPSDSGEMPDLWTWLLSSGKAVIDFEIAPDWTIGGILNFVVGLALAVWLIRVFLGG